MKTLFISDLHLQDGQDKAQEQLRRFLEGPARDSDAVYILGDLFEFWIGDDAVSPCARAVAQQTRALADSGVPCYFMHGNRDFLVGETYAAAAGMTLLPETQVVDLYGTPTLLLHGDTLCTDDIEYQAFRSQVRNPAWQTQVLAKTVEQRLEMARNARDASQAHTAQTAMDIMDVNEEAVQAAFRDHEVSFMIHGHTHRPATHQHNLGGDETGQRTVLADWYDSGSYLAVSADGYESVPL